MSITKQIPEVLTIRKAKYRVKNAEGKYELVYLETSADQVEETAERVFVTPAEKAKITSNEGAIAAETLARTQADNLLSGRLDVIEGVGEGSVKKALQDAKNYTDGKISEVNGANEDLEGRVGTLETSMGQVDGKISTAKSEAIEAAATDATSKVNAAKLELQGNINTLAGRVSTNESDISNLKDAVANKNNNTIVVDTEAEIATENSSPKIGDLAYVITSKRAYIYKGVSALSVKSVPQGWVVFDEITSELDLVDYLKKEDAESTYRKLANKIAEVDLATELASKINSKVDAAHVSGAIETAKTELKQLTTANAEAIAQEVSNRQSEVTRVEGVINTKIEGVNSTLTEKETALKAEDTKINNRISKFIPVVSADQPEETETGHVWLQLV